MLQSEKFDRYQFDGRHHYPVSAETCIDYSDNVRMHCYSHGGNRPWVPPFAMDDRILQHVLLVRAWRAVHHGVKPAPHIKREEIDKQVTAFRLGGYKVKDDAAPIQHEMAASHRAAIRRCGSYMSFQAGIAYRSWRLGMPSPEVAAEMGITPVCVRRQLGSIRAVARALGYDCGRAHHSLGVVRKPKASRREKIVALHLAGMSVADIVAHVGYKTKPVQGRAAECFVRRVIQEVERPSV